jgi:citronellol/citronellal dehydrogenase
MFQKPDLRGRVALITGGSRGIGREVALALAEAGCDISIAARSAHEDPRLPGTIYSVQREVEALGRRAIAVPCDVREEAQVAAAVAQTVEQLGSVDILVNNAGALWWKNVEDTPLKRFDLVMGINARASFAATYHCLPHMKARGWGHILTMSPPIDLAMVPGKVAYCISKFGMTLLAHGLAKEVAGDNIAINALWPATLIESQATINYGLGDPSVWRKASILADATLAILSHAPPTLTGQALIDEDILRRVGVSDFAPYLCTPDGEPMRIVGATAMENADLVSGVGGTPTR